MEKEHNGQCIHWNISKHKPAFVALRGDVKSLAFQKVNLHQALSFHIVLQRRV